MQHRIDPERKYDWYGGTVLVMLGKQEYMGHTVNFRSHKPSYKSKKIKWNDPSEWVIYENTHEPIVDPETWQLAQHKKGTKTRIETTGLANPLTGFVYCADCGEKMYNSRHRRNPNDDSGGLDADSYNCSTYSRTRSRETKVCCNHYISTKAIRTLLLDAIRTICQRAVADPEAFARQMRAEAQIQHDAAAKELKKNLARDRKRCTELDALFQKLYESYATGKITEKRFEMMAANYEAEQAELEQRIADGQQELDKYRQDEIRIDKFIELTSDMAEDLNGDSVYNENDLLTFVGERVPCGTWQTSLGLDVVVLDEAGKPTVLGMTERFVNAYDKMSAYHQNTPGVMRFASIDAQTYDSMKLFANGQVATMCNFIYSTEYIRDMEDDYGIIPIPKYDTEQENYITQLGTSTSMLFVPTTASDFALTSKVMESLAYYGYTDVTPKYYEVALKTKYSSDVDMQEMLDLIRETATIDFLFVYGTTLSSAPNEYFRFTSFIPGIASVYSKTQRVFEKSVEKLVTAYEKLP